MLLSLTVQVIRDLSLLQGFRGLFVPSHPLFVSAAGATAPRAASPYFCLSHPPPHTPTCSHLLWSMSAPCACLSLPSSLPQALPQYCCSFKRVSSYSFPTLPHSLMLFSCFLRFSFSFSFPCVQRQDVKEGQQRAKSIRAAAGDT